MRRAKPVILLVEPDRELATLYAAGLGRIGRVVRQYDAQGAIQAVDEANPQVIILELQLAQHNGLEFLYELRSYSDWTHTPVIILSFVPPARVQLSRLKQDLGVHAYLYKPQTNLKQLGDAVTSVLSNAQATTHANHDLSLSVSS